MPTSATLGSIPLLPSPLEGTSLISMSIRSLNLEMCACMVSDSDEVVDDDDDDSDDDDDEVDIDDDCHDEHERDDDIGPVQYR